MFKSKLFNDIYLTEKNNCQFVCNYKNEILLKYPIKKINSYSTFVLFEYKNSKSDNDPYYNNYNFAIFFNSKVFYIDIKDINSFDEEYLGFRSKQTNKINLINYNTGQILMKNLLNLKHCYTDVFIIRYEYNDTVIKLSTNKEYNAVQIFIEDDIIILRNYNIMNNNNWFFEYTILYSNLDIYTTIKVNNYNELYPIIKQLKLKEKRLNILSNIL
jgi:hypothetical protein